MAVNGHWPWNWSGTGLERVWNGLERGLERDGQIFQNSRDHPGSYFVLLCSTESYFVVQSSTGVCSKP